MKKENDFTAREIILAKAEIVRAMPDYRVIPSFDDWSKEQWRFDAEQYASDTDYAKQIDAEYERECRERNAYNYVLDAVYQTIA